jgi:uncharacterized protein (DUF2345 family)
MTLQAERPATSSSATETTPGTATGPSATTALRGGSYVTLLGGRVSSGVEGSYVTVAGSRNLPPATRGSYVTVAGAPAVAAGVIEGSYVTLRTAA